MHIGTPRLPASELGLLLQRLPATARRIGVAGEDAPANAAQVAALRADCEVLALPDLNPADAGSAQRLEAALSGLDAVLLVHLADSSAAPAGWLQCAARALPAEALLLGISDNAQYHGHLFPLIGGDVATEDGGDPATMPPPRRPLAYANLQKIYLDAGWLPQLGVAVQSPAPAEVGTALANAAAALKYDLASTRQYLNVRRFLIIARRWRQAEEFADDELPGRLTFVVNTNDHAVLRANFLASPCVRSGRHEVLLYAAPSAADGYNYGLSKASGDYVVFVHQDVFLPDGWDHRFFDQVHEARRRVPAAGVFGVFGVTGGAQTSAQYSNMLDRSMLLARNVDQLPARADTLDEVLLALPRQSPLRFEPALKFHLYAADICLSGKAAGIDTVVLDAPCFHNARLGWQVPADFQAIGEVFAAKWAAVLPVATPCHVFQKAQP